MLSTTTPTPTPTSNTISEYPSSPFKCYGKPNRQGIVILLINTFILMIGKSQLHVSDIYDKQSL